MILLDTNVVSEPLKLRPEPAVLAWLDAQDPGTLYLSTLSVAELLSGVEALPAGRKRTGLQTALRDEVLPMFGDRILPFDLRAAAFFAQIHSRARAKGAPVDFADCAIASIAAAHDFHIATRNVRDFAALGVDMINPWEAGA